MKIVIIGTGRMGFAQARIARYFGDEILCAFDIHTEKLQLFCETFGVHAAADIASCRLDSADLVFITVNDDAVETAAEKLAALSPQCAVMHTSGVLSSECLKKHLSCPCASYHPLMSCPLFEVSDEQCVNVYRGAIHCIEGDPAALNIAKAMIKRLDGECVSIKTSSKAAYHAAAVFASNYPVVLIDAAVKILVQCGFGETQAKTASLKLLDQASSAMHLASPAEALTGPAKRRDTKTIEMHRNALSDDNQFLELYDILYHAANRMCGYSK